MTLDQKLSLIHGAQENPMAYEGQAGNLAGIPRLGIPCRRFGDKWSARHVHAQSIAGRIGHLGRRRHVQREGRLGQWRRD